MEFGARLLNIINSKLHCVIGFSVLFTSVFCASLVTNVYIFVFIYAICSGLGYGLLYMLSLRPSWVFFPEKKGTVSGIILSFYGLGAIGWT